MMDHMRTNETYLTLTQIAERLNLARSTVTAYRTRKQMPEPDVIYGRTPLWRLATIEAWRPRSHA